MFNAVVYDALVDTRNSCALRTETCHPAVPAVPSLPAVRRPTQTACGVPKVWIRQVQGI